MKNIMLLLLVLILVNILNLLASIFVKAQLRDMSSIINAKLMAPTTLVCGGVVTDDIYTPSVGR